MKPFTNSRRWFWLGGIAALILGFIAAALVLPTTSNPSDAAGPPANVPRLQNVPPAEQRIKLDVNDKGEKGE